jgi:pantothenate kinase-related protein Tda10
MNKREVIVTVAGTAGAGKSAIQAVIFEALREKGFEVEMESLDFQVESEAISHGQMLLEYVPELVNKIKVIVKEKQISRLNGFQ